MATFLRDEHLNNVTLTVDRIRQIDVVFRARFRVAPENGQQSQTPTVFFFYVIRFDNKGYRVFSLDELISYFNQADHVERVIFTIESTTSRNTNRGVGTFMDLRFDARDANNCYLVASSDEADWMDSSFSAVKDVIAKCKNRHGLARGAWSLLSIQIGGVMVGFLLSLWAAVGISPFIKIENSFVITFLFALLVFSNLWGFINQRLLALVDATFPNVRFYRPDRDRLHWLAQALVGGVAIALSLFLLNLLFKYVGKIIGQWIGESP